MTEEKADQIIRCVKECWWRVGVLITLLLGGGLVARYGWPTDDLSLGWSMIGAVGTVVTGAVAVHISNKQAKWMEDEKKIGRAVFEKKVNSITMVFFAMMLNFSVLANSSKRDMASYGGLVSGLIRVLEKDSKDLEVFLDDFENRSIQKESYLKSLEMLNVMNSLINSFGLLRVGFSINDRFDKGVLVQYFRTSIEEFFDELCYLFEFSNVGSLDFFESGVDKVLDEILSSDENVYDFIESLRKKK